MKQRESENAETSSRINSCIFLGAILRGASGRSLLLGIVLVCQIFRQKARINRLTGGEELSKLAETFQKHCLMTSTNVVCFYESKAMFLNTYKVSIAGKQAATFDANDSHAWDLDHLMMNKFLGPDDKHYIQLSMIIRGQVQNIYKINASAMGNKPPLRISRLCARLI